MGIFGSNNPTNAPKGMTIYEVVRDSSESAKSVWNPPTDWDFVGVANGAYGNSVSLWFKDRTDGTLRVLTGFFPKDGVDKGRLILGDSIGELKRAGN